MHRYDKHIESIVIGQAQANLPLRIGQALQGLAQRRFLMWHQAMDIQNYR